MKRFQFLIPALFFVMLLNAQPLKTINARIQKVTVYMQGAQLFYSENVPIAAGTSEVVFENVSPYLIESSLQASSKGGVVMEVKHLMRYQQKVVVTRQYDKEIENVLDSMEEINYKIKDIDNKSRVLQTEKNMLLTNRIIKGEPLRDSLPLLKEGMKFLQEKLNEIYEQELALERSKAKATKLRDQLNKRYNMLQLLQSGQANENAQVAKPIHQVIITLFNESAVNSLVSFNYQVQQAGWIPQYDLQANSTGNNLQLKYFAQISQTSGLTWNNVPLTISTSNPNENTTKPELNPWVLSFIEYRRNAQQEKMSNRKMPTMAPSRAGSVDDAQTRAQNEDKELYEEYIKVTENMIRTEYEIKLNYTITDDGKVNKVMINQKEIPMLLEFASVPKLCQDAFLMARVAGWEDLSIIPGNARLYFDGSYIGEMFLTSNTVNDTLSINLGRDKSIAMTRKKIKENNKEKFIGDEKVETRTIELVVRNTKNMPIEMEIQDQIPIVSGTNDIKVTLLKGDGAIHEESTGKLTWKLKMNARSSEKITFTYEVRYPKGKPVAGL